MNDLVVPEAGCQATIVTRRSGKIVSSIVCRIVDVRYEQKISQRPFLEYE